MGSNSASGGGGGASGSDAGFANTQKSKLTKKNQELVDTSFRDRGALKIKRTVKKFPTPTLVIASTPLQAGSKITRQFFTDKVLTSKRGMKNLGTTKEEFEAMTMSQQEKIYGDYSRNRLSGKTDAYGNTIVRNDDGRSGNQVVTAPTEVIAQAPTNAEVSQSSTTDASSMDTSDPTYIKRKTKRVGRSPTILTGVTGATGGLTLGKKSLLGIS
tara:strand:- start:2919 stop:3560 length:642 start_codon:yes stop_codon:yes gene_type:complete